MNLIYFCISGTPFIMSVVQSRACLAQVSLPRTKTLITTSRSRTPHNLRFDEVLYVLHVT